MPHDIEPLESPNATPESAAAAPAAADTSAAPSLPPRRGAVGKAIIVYLFSGSAVVALLAFVLFRGMGC